ncbi:MAG: hypothetical protein U1E76_01265 [Planctomycetota bacterium]
MTGSLLALALLWQDAGDGRESMARAQALLRVGELDEALPLYLEACHATTPSFDALVNAAFVAKSLGKLELSRDLFEQAHRQAPSHPYPLEMLGTIAFERGEIEASERFLRQALVLSNSDAQIAGDLDSVRERRGMLDALARARSRLQRVVILVCALVLVLLAIAAWLVDRAARLLSPKAARPSPVRE